MYAIRSYYAGNGVFYTRVVRAPPSMARMACWSSSMSSGRSFTVIRAVITSDSIHCTKLYEPQGFDMPVLGNLFGTVRRIALAMGRDADAAPEPAAREQDPRRLMDLARRRRDPGS